MRTMVWCCGQHSLELRSVWGRHAAMACAEAKGAWSIGAAGSGSCLGWLCCCAREFSRLPLRRESSTGCSQLRWECAWFWRLSHGLARDDGVSASNTDPVRSRNVGEIYVPDLIRAGDAAVAHEVGRSGQRRLRTVRHEAGRKSSRCRATRRHVLIEPRRHPPHDVAPMLGLPDGVAFHWIDHEFGLHVHRAQRVPEFV